MLTEHIEIYKKKRHGIINQITFVILGLIFAIIVQKVFAKLSKPKYNRNSLENVMKEKLG